MKVIAILSQKGGAGKTTLALNLAVAAEKQNISTAVIDLDPQSSSAEWGDSREDEAPVVMSAQAARLPNILQDAKEAGAGMVILDTAPHAENVALTAARAADIVIIPCRPSVVDLRAIGATANLADIANTPAFVVLNQTPARGQLIEEAIAACKGLGVKVAPIKIGQRVSFVHAFTEGQGVLEYEPNGKASEEIEALYKFINNEIKEDQHGKEKLSSRCPA